MVARSYPRMVLHDRIDWSAERIIEKSSSMPVDDPAYQVGGVLPWERANTRSRASRLRVERKLTSAAPVSLRFSLFCGLRFHSFDREPVKCDPSITTVRFFRLCFSSIFIRDSVNETCSKRLFFGGCINKRTRSPGGIKKEGRGKR